MIKEELQKENEEKKEYLRSYQCLVRRAKILEEEIQELRLSKMFPSMQYDDMPHGNNNNDLSAYMAILDEKVTELTNIRYSKINRYMEITKQVESMENENEKNLLTLRYLRGLQWESICINMGYSWKQIHRYHSKALSNFMMT